MASGSDEWGRILDGHPVFSPPNSIVKEESLELSLSSLSDFKHDEETDEGGTPSGRREVMCMKDSDLILACGSEIRMASLNDAKISGGSQRTYKILHTPSIRFDIHQIRLSPNRKLLAVAGAFQVAVIVLPRSGFSKLVMARIDCKSLQVGQYYHTSSMSPIAKIDWHPWGDSGSTLLVMTVDGKLREYDVSLDPDEPRKTTDFVPEKKRGAYAAVDYSEREVTSFTFGKGKADWGPLTVYALMKSGDIYAVCPYLPESALIPSSYIHALECFVSAKQEFIADRSGIVDESFSTLYDFQRKYVNGLLKQLPTGTSYPSSSRFVSIHPPKSFTSKPARQGPFLFQPSPPELKGSPGGDATDLVYLTLGEAFGEDDESETSSAASERLGVLLIAYQDGRVDVCLDLEKVEAKWEVKRSTKTDLPAFAVYEVIDLGLISTLTRKTPSLKESDVELLQANHPVLHTDPIYDDTIYVYHSFGVHILNLNPILANLASALKEEDEKVLETTLQKPSNTLVQAILSTYSVERGSSNPVTAVTIPNDVYLTYSIFILTSSFRVATLALNLRTEPLNTPDSQDDKHRETSALPALPPSSGPPSYVSILKAKEFVIPPNFSRPLGLSPIAKLALPKSHDVKAEILLTPETLRYITSVGEKLLNEIYDAQKNYRELQIRIELQRQEYEHLQITARNIVKSLAQLNGPRKAAFQSRLKQVQENQVSLLGRMDKVLQALINKASPELNDHETRWFEELQRMKGQVLGAGRFDSGSLKYRIQQLKNDYDRLLPALKELAKKEVERKEHAEESSSGAGFAFTEVYEKLSKEERRRIDSAMQQVVKLAGKLDISGLGPPP